MLRFLFLILLPISCLGAELNCSSASKEFDIYLCNAHEISKLDKKLNSIYSTLVEHNIKSENVGRENNLKTEQLKWLTRRDICLKSEGSHSCLVAMYQVRIIELTDLLPENYQAIMPSSSKDNFTTQQLEYSHWSGRELNPTWKWPWEEKKKIKRHYFRKKAVLINTSTGETWGLEYTGTRATSDGYGWVKIPMKSKM